MKKGFTLAESLVTMAVIGVIAAILLPMLTRVTPNEEMIMLKKAYYLTGRIVTELINDDILYPETGNNATDGFANGTTVPYHNENHGDASKFCTLFAARLNVRTDRGVNCANVGQGAVNFTSQDGIRWSMPATAAFANGGWANIIVDVNGVKRPNCAVAAQNNTCTKPDQFRIQVNQWGNIRVPDEATRRYLQNTDITRKFDELPAQN